MGLRETLNRNPAITTGATIAIIVVALIWISLQMFGSNRPPQSTKGYFTTDDGKNWFADSLDNLPPYMHEGKEAVRAYLYKCGDGKTFVAYLERYTPEAKKIIEKSRATLKANPQDIMARESAFSMAVQNGREAKKALVPGPWIQNRDYIRYSQVVQINCPEGQSDSLEQVQPR